MKPQSVGSGPYRPALEAALAPADEYTLEQRAEVCQTMMTRATRDFNEAQERAIALMEALDIDAASQEELDDVKELVEALDATLEEGEAQIGGLREGLHNLLDELRMMSLPQKEETP